MNTPQNPVIAAFIEQYRKDKPAYLALRNTMKKRLETLLKKKGIMAIVSARVKDPERLEQKLLQLEAQRIAAGQGPFRNAEDIYDDVHDLVGARVALYFPGDAGRVDELIQNGFRVVTRKSFPPKAEHYGEMVRTGYTAHKRRIYPGYEDRRFDGYCAIHHHVRFTDQPVPALSDTVIEIQVASVLMHAWSEVEHDLAYKQLMGPVSQEEYACLDELNGLMMAGELVLNRLSQLSQQRLQGITHFESPYALAAYLTYWQKQHGYGALSLGNVDTIYDLYRERDLLTADHVRSQLETLERQQGINDVEPLAEQLLELFNRKNRKLVTSRLSDSVLELGGEKPDAPTKAQLTHFQQRWNVLVDTIGKALRRVGQVPNNRTSKLLMLSMDHTLTREFSDAYNRLRPIRDQILYGYMLPTQAELKSLINEVDGLIRFLKETYLN